MKRIAILLCTAILFNSIPVYADNYDEKIEALDAEVNEEVLSETEEELEQYSGDEELEDALDKEVSDSAAEIEPNSVAEELVASIEENIEEISEDEMEVAYADDIITQSFYSANLEKDLEWTLDRSTGELTISGNAAMYTGTVSSSNKSTYAPWLTYASEIITVKIMPGITAIGSSAFEYCRKLENVSIPDTVTVIGSNAFFYCSVLDNVIIPDSVIEIGGSAFNSCEGLKEIKLSNKLERIKGGAFCNCNSIEEIALPESLEMLGQNVFSGDKALKSIEIPNKIIDIPANAFYACSVLESVSLPDELKSIGNRSFASCYVLDNVVIPEGVESIDYEAFAWCRGLQSIALPASLQSIGTNTFRECKVLETVDLSKVEITALPEYMFYSCPELKTVKLNSKLEQINQFTFFGCIKLEAIRLPDRLKSIGPDAFCNCSALADIDFPDSIEIIDREAFYQCSSLGKCMLRSGIKNIGDNAFENCKSISQCSLPTSIETVGEKAFYSCPQLKEVTVLATHCEIKTGAFSYNSSSNMNFYGYTDATLWDYFKAKASSYSIYHFLDNSDCVRGRYGSTIIWEYDFNSKRLEFNGTGGENLSYSESDIKKIAWNSYADQIEEIIIGEGITKFNKKAFFEIKKLKKIVFPSTYTRFENNIIGPVVDCDVYINSNNNDFRWTNSTSYTAFPVNYAYLHLYRNSSAESYAKIYGYDYEVIDPETEDKHLVTGKVGSKAYFDFDEITKTLKIYGEGSINDYTDDRNDYVGGMQTVRYSEYLKDSIEHVYIMNGITYIPNSAFWAFDIKDIDIAPSVVNIGSNAFYYCRKLEKINIYNDTCNFSNYLFAENKYLVINCNEGSKAEAEAKKYHVAYKYFDEEKIYGYFDENITWTLSGNELIISGSGKMPNISYKEPEYFPYDSLASFYPYAGEIKKLKFEDGITEIGKYNFYGLHNLERVEFADSITLINDYAFTNCSKLNDVILPSELNMIGENVFEGCVSLIEMDIPDSVTSVGTHAFKDCSSLEKIIINNPLCAIGVKNDKENVPVHTVIFGHTGSKAESYAKTYKRQFFCMDDGVMDGECGDNLWWQVDTNTGILTISGNGAMEDYTYTYSGCSAPWNLYKKYITKLVVEEGVTTIGSYAFYYFTGLRDIKLPDSLKEIHDHAFYGCNNAGTIKVPDGVIVQGNAFFGCRADGEIYIKPSANPGEITKEDTQSGYDFIEELIIPRSVLRIGEGAFGGLYRLKKITILNPDCEIFDSEDTIYDKATIRGYSDSSAFEYALKYNRKFEAIDGLTFLGQCGPQLYYYLDIRKGILKITGSGAMYDYTEGELPLWERYGDKIETIILPNEITTIGNYGFYNCTAFRELRLPEGLTSIGDYGFCGCSSLITIILPETLRNIGVAAFKNCINLVVISIPEGVMQIKDRTFEGCEDLSDVNIVNKNLTSVGDEAFKHCPSLKPVEIPQTADVGSNIFDGCDGITSYNKLSDIEEVKDETFSGCESLEVIWIPESVKKIGLRALAACIKLKKVTIMNKNCTIYDAEDTIYETATLYGYINSTAQRYAKKYGRKFVALEGTYASGVVSENIVYEVFIDQNKLVISGEGVLPDYENKNSAPWYEYKDYIKTIEISDGITVIGKNDFSNMKYLEEVKLPEGITDIKENAFNNCDELEKINLEDNTNVDPKAFYGSDIIESKQLAEGIETIDSTTFEDKKNQIKTIVLPENVISISENAFADYYWLDKLVINNPTCEIFDSNNTIYRNANIYGYKDSTAEEYAKKYNRNFVVLTVEEENPGEENPGEENPGEENPGEEKPEVNDNNDKTEEIVFDEILKKNSEESYSVILVKGGKVSIEDIKKEKSDGSNYKITSSNAKVAAANAKGIIIGKSAGDAVVTVIKPDKEIKINITVTEPKFSQKSIIMNVDDVVNTEFSGTTLKPEYSVNKSDIASIDANGKLTAHKKGNVVVIAKVNGKNYKLKVKVYNPHIVAKATTVAVNKTIALKVKDGYKKTEWSSMDPSIATVVNGKVTGVKAGKVIIKAVNNNCEMTQEIVVKE